MDNVIVSTDKHYKVRDLSGQKFGMLQVLRFVGINERRNALFECRCDCGNNVIRVGSELKRKRDKRKNCGCYKFNRINIDRNHKICSKCNIDKNIDEFGKQSAKSDGRSVYCKKCWRELSSTYRIKNIDRYRKNYRLWIKRSPHKRMVKVLRSRVNCAIKRKTKLSKKYRVESIKIAELVGCSIDNLILWIENQFDGDMKWENYGSYWHIDHIKPCAMFDLTDEKQCLECFNYSNLQPLRASENMKKGAKYNGKDFRVWGRVYR